METLTKTDKILNFIENKYVDDEIDNDSLVQIIEHCGRLLNLKTISQYSKDNNISYNGVKNYRKCLVLFNTKFVIDND